MFFLFMNVFFDLSFSKLCSKLIRKSFEYTLDNLKHFSKKNKVFKLDYLSSSFLVGQVYSLSFCILEFNFMNFIRKIFAICICYDLKQILCNV